MIVAGAVEEAVAVVVPPIMGSAEHALHGAHCAACMKELFYTYEQNKAGKTAAQIREGIIKGEWEKIDLQAAAAD